METTFKVLETAAQKDPYLAAFFDALAHRVSQGQHLIAAIRAEFSGMARLFSVAAPAGQTGAPVPATAARGAASGDSAVVTRVQHVATPAATVVKRGRGRPRKLVEAEAPEPPVRRRRRRKARVEAAPVKRRGPGRPRKQRGPGRPRKVTSRRRGPGRPRKPQVELPAAAVAVAGQPLVKRGRGRPRKIGIPLVPPAATAPPPVTAPEILDLPLSTDKVADIVESPTLTAVQG